MTDVADNTTNGVLTLDVHALVNGWRARSGGVFRWSDREAVTLKRAVGYLRYVRRQDRRKR